jgi:LEA14-like dessication related protein
MLFRLFVMFALFALAGCSALPLNAVPPKVSVAEVEVRSLGLFEQHFDVGLRVANPNDYDLTIEALDFELEINGRPLAKGVSRGGVLIPAASSTVVRVDATMQSHDLIEQIKALQTESLKDGVPYRIRGRVKTGRSPLWLPFDHRGVYGSDAKPPAGPEA